MRIFVIKNVQAAKDCRQLLGLKSECAKLQWSRTINNIPQSVMNSLESVENYVDEKVEELCRKTIVEYEIDLNEEEILLAAIKTKGLTLNLGSGVVLEDEVENVIALINGYDMPTVKTALENGANIVIK